MSNISLISLVRKYLISFMFQIRNFYGIVYDPEECTNKRVMMFALQLTTKVLTCCEIGQIIIRKTEGFGEI